MLRDAAISLSLANLCFIKVWSKLLSGAGSYFMEFPVTYASILADVVLLAVVFIVGITIVRRRRYSRLRQIARCAFLLTTATVLNGIGWLVVTTSSTNAISIVGRSGAWFLAVGVTSLMLVTVVRVRERVIQWAPRVVLMLLPFVLFTFSQAIWRLSRNIGVAHAQSSSTNKKLSSPSKPALRIVWIIFDELDQRMTFAQRPANVELPELDRLRNESVYATNAYPPAPLTYMSMPALISGKLVAQVRPVSTNELMVKFDGATREVGWSTQPNIFSAAQSFGYKTALAGWCHPYCEVIGSNLSKCDEAKDKENGDLSLRNSMVLQAEGAISTVPLLPQLAIPIIQRVSFVNRFVTTGERQKYIARYNHVREATLKAVVDPELDLVFIHFPIPHPPGIYDPVNHQLTVNSKSGYLGNLVLVDQTLGELRQAMEAADTWNRTAVIISADHWWRAEMWSRGPFWTKEENAQFAGTVDHRVPFILKLPRQTDSLIYNRGFNTIVTHDLVLALMRNEVTTADGIAAWLDRHNAIADSPYNRDEFLP